MTTRKIILSAIAIAATAGAKAQVIDVYENDLSGNTPTSTLIKTYYNCASKRNKVLFKKGTASNSDSSTDSDATSEDYDVAEIYENDKWKETYTNTSSETYTVVFRERDWVEIGGVKWATMNVGATTVADNAETAFGDYYAWGEIVPYYESITYKYEDDTNNKKVTGKTVTYGTGEKTKTHIDGVKTGYDMTNYYGQSTFSEWDPAPYGTDKNLTSAYDAATYEWGGNWRMPTVEEFMALRNACYGKSSTWYPKTVTDEKITDKGAYLITAGQKVDDITYNVDGIILVGQQNNKNSNVYNRIFIPITGSNSPKAPEFVFIWSSSLNSGKSECAYYFGMAHSQSSNVLTDYSNNGGAYRYYGYPIRPVYVGE